MTLVADYTCHLCAHAGRGRCKFFSQKALESHMRAKHKARNPLRQFLDATGVCPVCQGQYGTRTRALAHVSERRQRGKSTRTCRAVLEAGVLPPLPPDVVAKLDDLDRMARKRAFKQRHTQPVAIAPAKRTKGPNESESFGWRPLKRLRTKTSFIDVHWVVFATDSTKRAKVTRCTACTDSAVQPIALAPGPLHC